MRFTSNYIVPLIAVFLVVGLVGCQDSMVAPEPEAPSEDLPLSEQEFRDRMSKDGMVILEEDQYDAFGVEIRSPDVVQSLADGEAVPKTEVCTNRSSSIKFGTYFYSVCSEVNTVTVYNVDYFRVTIDASSRFACLLSSSLSVATNTEKAELIEPIEPIDPVFCPKVALEVTSSTVRSDGVVLQDNVTDAATSFVSTSFVALYPKVDTFSFNHTSFFDPPTDSINVTVTP